MIEVIKRGIAPSELVYESSCGTCNSRLRYRSADLEHCQRERDSWVRCPVCKGVAYHKGAVVADLVRSA